MPIYAYRCQACDNEFEARQSFSDDPLTICDTCGGRLRKLLGNVGVVFKGSGFYSTDKSAGAGKRAGQKGGADAAGSDTGAAGSGGPGSGDAGSTNDSGSTGAETSAAHSSGSAGRSGTRTPAAAPAGTGGGRPTGGAPAKTAVPARSSST